MRLQGKAFYNPANGSWGRIKGNVSCGSYYICEEHGAPTLVMRVVYIGDMKRWSLFRTVSEAEVAAEKGGKGR